MIKEQNEYREEQSPQDRENIYKQTLKTVDQGGGKLDEDEDESEGDTTKQQPSQGIAPGSLGKVKTDVEKKEELHAENVEKLGGIGYRKIDTANLPSKGMFNDATLRIRIRAATVEEIKHYSGLDETDLMDVSDHINEILMHCAKIEYADRVGKANDLMEADKYYLLFAVRDLTMESNQRHFKLWQRVQCPKCGKKSENEITSNAFSFYQIPKKIAKYYDSEKRKIIIDDDNFGEPLMISPPSVGLTVAIQKYMQDHARKQQQQGASIYFDAKFMLRLQYILDSPSQVNQMHLEQLQKKMAAWSPDKIVAFEYVRDNMDVGITPRLEIICRESKAIDGNEVGCTDDFSFTAPVVFRNGWRSILDISGVITRLFDSDPE